MITIRNSQHLARLLRHLRETAGITRRDLAARLFVSQTTIANREQHQRGVASDALVDHAHALGHQVALIRERRPGGRPTGTGWPA